MWKRVLREKVVNKEEKEAHKKMEEQLKSFKEGLHFKMVVDKNGWFAQCVEIPEIITGGDEADPTQTVIIHSTINAIKTAFDVPITELSERSPYSYPKITIQQDFQLA